MEVSSPWASSLAVLLATAALFLAAILRSRHLQQARKHNLPPGPRPWPVIGNLNLLGPLPHRSIRDLSARHGPLMSLRFGSFPVVVASSVEAAEFFLKTHDLAFLDRPRMACGKYTVYNYSGMLWSHYGAYWRQLRKLWLTELLSAKQLRLTEHVRADEVRAMLRDLRLASSAAGGGGAAVVLKDHLLMVTLNVVSRMVLGRKYVGEGAGPAAAAVTPEEFRWMIEEIFFLNGALHVGDMVPWLGWFDPNGYVGRMKRLAKMFDAFVEHVLREHEDRRRREGPAFVPRDMVDMLLQLADDSTLDVPIDRDGVKASILVRLRTYDRVAYSLANHR
jgi:hypothetical protein